MKTQTLKTQIEKIKMTPLGRERRADEIYQIIAGNYGLFQIAFFNYKGTKKQYDKLRYIRKIVFAYNN